MAEAFVRQLPRIPSCALPSDAICPICVQPYENLTTDSGSLERAVALPCSDMHIIGSDCLTEWLTCGKNCPFCRRIVTLPKAADRVLENMGGLEMAFTLSFAREQEFNESWYRIFWILNLRGDRAVEGAWHEWQEDCIWAENEFDESCYAQARAALSSSPLMTANKAGTPRVIKSCAVAIQTLRFREYRLFLRFQANAGEYPELKAPPGYQLTPAQEEELLHELDRRRAFELVLVRMPGFSIREKWNTMRNIGLVWDPDWNVSFADFPGRWSLHAL